MSSIVYAAILVVSVAAVGMLAIYAAWDIAKRRIAHERVNTDLFLRIDTLEHANAELTKRVVGMDSHLSGMRAAQASRVPRVIGGRS